MKRMLLWLHTQCFCGEMGSSPTDNPQEQGITVVPLNVEVRYRSAGARRKIYLFRTTKVSQVLDDYALNKFKEQDG
jgi:hypothetical protein